MTAVVAENSFHVPVDDTLVSGCYIVGAHKQDVAVVSRWGGGGRVECEEAGPGFTHSEDVCIPTDGSLEQRSETTGMTVTDDGNVLDREFRFTF